jgi:hypothetical protein
VARPPVAAGSLRDLYIILSVVGWAWCLLVAAFLWVRLRNLKRPRPGVTDGAAVPGASEGRPEADV